MPPITPDPTRNPHALEPDGTFRGSRLPAGLGKDYVAVDGKSATEALEFLRRVAALVRFVGPTNEVGGYWAPFYDNHSAPTVARLLTWPLERLGVRFAEHRELIEDRQSPLPPEQLLANLFDLLTSAVFALDELTERLPAQTPLRERAEALIRHTLAPAYRRWLAYYRAAATVYFPAPGPAAVPEYLRDTYAAGGRWVTTAEVDTGGRELRERWTDGNSMTDYLAALSPDDTVYGTAPSVAGAAEEILHAVGHVFFHGVYELFVSSALHLRSVAQETWRRLQSDPGHAPHVALVLAYLRMREEQRRMLNGLTDRHLQFYYQRVLRTRPAAPRPPVAFLHLEARKNLPATYLPPGTPFRGGKDPESGTERSFASRGAVTVSAAALREKRALYRVADHPAEGLIEGENRKPFPGSWAGRYLAATVVDSADGGGDKELPASQHGWYPFGHLDKSGPQITTEVAPARLGLAIASHYLYLLEGQRTISLRLAGVNAPASGIKLMVHLTTKEGWVTRERKLKGDTLSLDLDPEDPAITPYDEAVHAQGLATRLPVMRLEAPQDSHSSTTNAFLREARFSSVRIGLSVVGIRRLALSGSAGVIDPARPFLPFGPAPRQGDVLYIGNEEVFQKRGAVVRLHWEWAGGASPGSVKIKPARLSGGKLEDGLQDVSLSAKTAEFTVDAGHVTPISVVGDVPYRAGSSRGYLGWTLRGHWGHAGYPAALAAWAAAKATASTDDDHSMPAIPFHPLLEEISLDYTLDFNASGGAPAEDIELFHLTPFGSVPTSSPGPFLHPDILPQTGAAAGAAAGALYLGIEHWEPGSPLSLLVQIAEGTADPLLEKPDDHLQWRYLDDNGWAAFGRDKIFDGTNGLLRSGLVRLDLPRNVRPGNTRFNDELQWIRLSVERAPEAVNRLMGIHTNGVEVVQALAPGQTVTDQPLPAGTVTKLRYPRPGIRAVHQPYPTFDGAAAEGRDAYFTRLSERLRHKDRGITEWDVEHLVLERFPAVERLICLQHLQFEPGHTAADHIYHELKAGHVTVLPLGRSGENGLRPYVSLRTREEIHAFLRERMSCHATVHVRNPLFEEVRVEAHIRFREGTDEQWAMGQVNRDLIDYLSPWHAGSLGGIDFTATVHRSGVVNRLEALTYVDYVEQVALRHLGDATQNGRETLRPTKLVSVLVAAPAHLIHPLAAANERALREVCSPLRGPRRRGSFTITETPIVR